MKHILLSITFFSMFSHSYAQNASESVEDLLGDYWVSGSVHGGYMNYISDKSSLGGSTFAYSKYYTGLSVNFSIPSKLDRGKHEVALDFSQGFTIDDTLVPSYIDTNSTHIKYRAFSAKIGYGFYSNYFHVGEFMYLRIGGRILFGVWKNKINWHDENYIGNENFLYRNGEYYDRFLIAQSIFLNIEGLYELERFTLRYGVDFGFETINQDNFLNTRVYAGVAFYLADR